MRLKAQTGKLAEHSEALAEAMGLNIFVRKGVWGGGGRGYMGTLTFCSILS